MDFGSSTCNFAWQATGIVPIVMGPATPIFIGVLISSYHIRPSCNSIDYIGRWGSREEQEQTATNVGQRFLLDLWQHAQQQRANPPQTDKVQ